MEELWKFAAIGVTAAALGLTIRKRNEEQAFLLGLLAAALILIGTFAASEPVFRLIGLLQRRSGIQSGLFAPVVKSLGLALLGKLSEDFCKDAGQNAAASALELGTSCAILCAAEPLVEALLETVLSML